MTSLDAKRGFDVVASGAGLLLCSPAMAVIAVAVKRDSAGPALFRQERVGRGGRTFEILKFRTMTTQASGPAFSSVTDDRITRVGRILRRTKLDELPQLVNVLQGEMSIVGPRPEVPHYVARWPDQARPAILSVRPGLTDPAAIAYRNEADELGAAADPGQHYEQVILPRKAAMYVDYVRNQSFLGDLAIIARTLVTVVRD